MTSIERRQSLTAQQRADVHTLAAWIEDETGAPPLNDQTLLQLGQTRPGLVHLIANEDEQLVAYAQLDGSAAELAVPAVRAGELLAAVEDAAPAALTVWTHGGRSAVAAAVAARGYRRTRELQQLRLPLSAPIEDVAVQDGVQVRAFVPGSDEQPWLQVNAAAFATHAEQGRWTLADLAAREGEPWFDPAGFLLAWRDDELLGFHWTKVHPDGAGEVYVLGVAPSARGIRLGPALLAAGLRHLTARGCRFVLLYVDGSNDAALRLYHRFGFHVHDTDAQWHSP